jgi:hypothetical protein
VKDYRVRSTDVTFTGRCDFGRRSRQLKFSMRELNGQFQIEIERAYVPIKRCVPNDLKDVAAARAEIDRFERENATPLQKVTGFWAASPELCQRAFSRDDRGTYGIAPTLASNEVALIVSPRRRHPRFHVHAGTAGRSPGSDGTRVSGILCLLGGGPRVSDH